MNQITKSMFSNPLLQYNQENIQKIVDICDPLKKYFGITYFGYFRAFNDGRYVLISNNQSILELVVFNDYFFRTDYCSKMTQYLYKRELNKIVWPSNVKDETLEAARANGVYNGFNIIKEREGTLEGYWFGTDKEHPLIDTLYKNNSSLLEEFIIYFHKIGHELCDTSDSSKQGVSPYLRRKYPNIDDMFEGANSWEKKSLEFNLLLDSKIQNEIHEIAKINHLTSRELQCLFQLSTGKTVKEIARTLSIGPRTVETYIDKIRLKTSCATQRQIIQWFDDKFSFYL